MTKQKKLNQKTKCVFLQNKRICVINIYMLSKRLLVVSFLRPLAPFTWQLRCRPTVRTAAAGEDDTPEVKGHSTLKVTPAFWSRYERWLRQSFLQHLTLFRSSLFSSMSRLHFCSSSASSTRRASASTCSEQAAPRRSLMKLSRTLRTRQTQQQSTWQNISMRDIHIRRVI